MSGFFLIMKRRLQLWKKTCQSRVADENVITSAGRSEEVEDNNVRGGGGGGFSFWLLMKAPLSCLAPLINHSQSSSNNGEEEENISGGEENGRDPQQIWFANDPAMAERNYLAVQNSMRYVIYM